LIENGLQLATHEATAAIQKRTSFLATIANVATLLGLLGTIAGLIASFEAVGHADPQQKSALLAAGISTAMNATMMGLGVAIPCMVAFSFLMNSTNRLIGDIDQAAIRVMDILKQRYYQAEAGGFQMGSQGDSTDSGEEGMSAPTNGHGPHKVVNLRRSVS
jgi:biopolymer transport protein ExbB/TolQ